MIAYDPNIRVNVDADVARWRDALAWMLPRTTRLKVSDEDLALLFPGAQPATLTTQWLLAGVALREVMDFAVRAAAITCSRRGADLPRRHEL